jgi:hypothetical protein
MVINTAQILEQFVGQLQACLVDRVMSLDAGQHPGGLDRRYLLGKAAGDKVAEDRVQAADNAVTGAAQVPVPPDPDLHHRGVILDSDGPDAGRAQRRHGNGSGIVGTVLVHRVGVEQSHPRGQLGLNIEDLLAGCEQLLREQASKPGRAFDRPHPIRPGRSPRAQILDLSRARTYSELAKLALVRIERERGV